MTELAKDWRRPQHARALVLVAPAMGVKRQYYGPFLDYLAGEGFASLVADYTGIGDSPRRDVDLKDWAEQDLEHLLALALDTGLPVVWFGHSVGGQLFGLLREPRVQGAVFVASQSGYWKHWPSLPKKLAMLTLWHVGVPVAVGLTGKLPMKLFRQGEDVPRRVANQWAEWGRDPGYIQRYARAVAPRAFQTYTGRVHSFAIADDAYAPPESVEQLNIMYEKANIERHLLPAPMGHFGPFRRSRQTSIWPQFRDTLGTLIS